MIKDGNSDSSNNKKSSDINTTPTRSHGSSQTKTNMNISIAGKTVPNSSNTSVRPTIPSTGITVKD